MSNSKGFRCCFSFTTEEDLHCKTSFLNPCKQSVIFWGDLKRFLNFLPAALK